MTRLILSLLFITFLLVQVTGQPVPCGPLSSGTGSCFGACIVCNLDGFSGRHEGESPGIVPEGFCTFIQHNIRWIGFIAGSEDLTLDFHVGSCLLGSGLEIGLFKADACTDFVLISECRGGNNPVRPGSTLRLTVNEKLTIGQHYYAVMDGNFGDNCDWMFEVVEGKATVEPLVSTGEIKGSRRTCTGYPNLYSLEPVPGAIEYSWSLNGDPLRETSHELVLPFLQEGNYQLCVTAKNACDESPVSCMMIRVVSEEPTLRYESFCEDSCFELEGFEFCDPGIYEVTLESLSGCDSVIILHLDMLPNRSEHLNLHICEGDSFRIGNAFFDQTGSWQESINTQDGCDSTITLDLLVVVCNIEGTLDIRQPSCHRAKDGSITFQVTNGTPPFKYTIQNVDHQVLDYGYVDQLNQAIGSQGFKLGQYAVIIDDNYGNQEILWADVPAPDPLDVRLIPKDYLGYGVSCPKMEDGLIEATASGGTGPYNFTWNNGMTGPVIRDLSSGLYRVVVYDQNNCSTAETVFLPEPESLTVEGHFSPVTCTDTRSGIVNLRQSHGGTGSLSFSINGSTFIPFAHFTGLTPGTYTLTAMDENQCVASHTSEILSPDIPEIKMNSTIEVHLGDSIFLDPVLNNVELQEILWEPSEMVKCRTCLSTYAKPMYSSSVTLKVMSMDGCESFFDVFMDVIKDRQFYAPNIFSPNGDGINDSFLILGGIEVAAIRKLLIYDRWGNLIFSEYGLAKDESADRGWDGTFKGQKAPSNTYVWMAEIDFIDGETKLYQGNVTLIR